jgi:anion-transporting  ArsA/GET3 family ATPase
MFTNPEETGVVVVTLPEELPVTETLELVKSVRHELELPLALLVVNAVLPSLFSTEERTALSQIETIGVPATDVASAVQAGARRALQEELQAKSVARLDAGIASVGLPRVVLPYWFDDAATPPAITALSAHF